MYQRMRAGNWCSNAPGSRALEDGYYAVDNLPIGLIPAFAELTHDSHRVRRAAMVVDVREGGELSRFPDISTDPLIRYPPCVFWPAFSASLRVSRRLLLRQTSGSR